MVLKWVAAAVCLVLAGPAYAGETVLSGETPAWVRPVEVDTASPKVMAEFYRFQLLDQQYRYDGARNQTFFRYRASALTPQGLQTIGAVALNWSPTVQDLVVHHVTILRDGQEIDVLASQAFEVLRREQRLETAMLDGVLTATLQPAGLRVGDELDVAYSIVTNDSVLGAHAEALLSGFVGDTIERLHASASWPLDANVRVRATDGWTMSAPRRRDGFNSVEIDMRDVEPLAIPSDAPIRYGMVRQLEVTDYRNWGDLSRVMAPLYDRAQALEAGSPLAAEIARIVASSDDPQVRVAAALRLVQDEVRYLALNIGDAGLTPATADETWRRRFGDCKGKTVLLLALLHGLGVEAVPAAVSTTGGDGLDQRLPMVGALDHVLVRALIDGAVYWLDGARSGDRYLSQITPPPYRWALPLVEAGAELEPIPLPALDHPTVDLSMEIDASAGIYAPSSFKGEMMLQGDAALAVNSQLSMLPAAQKDQLLKGMWSGQLPSLDIESAEAQFDAETSRLTMTVTGKATLDWSGQGLRVPSSSLTYSIEAGRADGPYKSAPYILAHPSFMRQRISIRLPAEGRGFTFGEASVDREAGGYAYHRSISRDGETASVEATVRSLVAEVSLEEAKRAKALVEEQYGTAVRIKAPDRYSITDQDRAAWDALEAEDANALVNRGLALASSGQAEEALRMYDRAIVKEPDNANAVANRGIQRFWSGDLEGARVDFDKASDLDPSERIAMNGHALLAMREGEYRDAVVEMSRALRQTPRDKFTLMLRAGAYEQLGEIDKALADVDVAISALPDDPEPKLRRMDILVRANRLDEAASSIDALVAVEPGNPALLLTSASIKARRGEVEAAAAIYDQLLEDAPGTASYRLIRAEFLIDQGRIEDAQVDMQAVRDLADDRAVLFNNLCWMQATRGLTLDQAMADCDRALAMAPDEASFLDSRAMVLLQTGQIEAALVLYDRILAKTPQLTASLYGRGLARIALGQSVEGEADKAVALSRSPDVAKSFKAYEAKKDSPAPEAADQPAL